MVSVLVYRVTDSLLCVKSIKDRKEEFIVSEIQAADSLFTLLPQPATM